MTTKLTDTDLNGYAFVCEIMDHPTLARDTLAALVAEVREYRALLAGVPVDRAVVVDANDLRLFLDDEPLVGDDGQEDWLATEARLRARLAERDARDGA